MPKPLNVDWPAVRVLAVAVGVREAARQMGISQDAVRQRSKREGWMASPKAVAQRTLAKPVTSVSPNALSPLRRNGKPHGRSVWQWLLQTPPPRGREAPRTTHQST